MAIFRNVHVSFWSDSFVSELNVDRKLFYIYLLTNERTKQCGIYEITKKQISYDLGYSIDTVSILLQYFIDRGKIRYNSSTSELAIKNWLKYNSSRSPKVKICVNRELELVKDTLLIQYVKGMDTHLQEEQEEEQDTMHVITHTHEEEKNVIPDFDMNVGIPKTGNHLPRLMGNEDDFFGGLVGDNPQPKVYGPDDDLPF